MEDSKRWFEETWAWFDGDFRSADNKEWLRQEIEAHVAAEVAKYKEAIIWCSGSEDFQNGGKARIGWEEVCKPLI